MKRFLLVYGGILLFLAVVVGIVFVWRHLDRGPSTVLTSACDPPCWHGIVPGDTKSVSVVNILMDLPWVSQGIRERTRGYNGDEILINEAPRSRSGDLVPWPGFGVILYERGPEP